MATLSEDARKTKNDYQRNWRRKNPERLKQHIANYWERKALKNAQAERAIIEALGHNKCKTCGKDIVGMRKDAKFCPPGCRQKFYRHTKQH